MLGICGPAVERPSPDGYLRGDLAAIPTYAASKKPGADS